MTIYPVNIDGLLNFQMFIPFDKAVVDIHYLTGGAWGIWINTPFCILSKFKTKGEKLTDACIYNPSDLDSRIGGSALTPVLDLDIKNNIKYTLLRKLWFYLM